MITKLLVSLPVWDADQKVGLSTAKFCMIALMLIYDYHVIGYEYHKTGLSRDQSCMDT